MVPDDFVRRIIRLYSHGQIITPYRQDSILTQGLVGRFAIETSTIFSSKNDLYSAEETRKASENTSKTVYALTWKWSRFVEGLKHPP